MSGPGGAPSSSGEGAVEATAPERRCRSRPRPQPRAEGELRPTDVVGAFFVCGIAFLAAAAVAGVAQAASPWPWGRWLALHLAFVGGVSQLVLGASQFFIGAFLATDPPPRRLVRGQLLAWNAGAALLAVAIPERWAALTWVAVGLLLAGLCVWGAAVAAMRRGSLRRSPWATRWYIAAAACLAVGVVGGALLARGVAWTHGNLLAAHMALNLGGWFGAAIVGTLHTFYPSLTRTELRVPRLQGVAFGLWVGGVLALAGGYGWSVDWLAVGGWGSLCLAAAALLVNVAASFRAAARPLSLAARLVGAAQPFLLAGLVTATIAAIADGPGEAVAGSARTTVGTLLVVGWIGLTVLGSLLHLLAVVLRVRGGFATRMPEPRPSLDTAVAAVVALGVGATALAQGAGLDALAGPGRALVLAGYLVVAAQIATLAARILARARPSV